MGKSLSIIITTYNHNELTNECLKSLDEQVKKFNKDVEVIVIDDGSKIPFVSDYNWCKVINKANGGVSSARNLGLDSTSGEYVCFIDGDDIVKSNYIESILTKIKKEKYDYLYFSWEAFGGWKQTTILNSIDDEFPAWNCCVWSRSYRRKCIGNTRFNEIKKIAEDAEFIREVQKKCIKKSFIKDILYLYRSGRQDSLTQSFARGQIYTKRIIYNYNHITKDMAWLIDEVKELDKTGEVIILTNQNDLPELKEHAMIMAPCPIKGTELRGEQTNFFTKIYLPVDCDVIMYTDATIDMGGIETFIYDWCMNMKDKYSITVLYSKMAQCQIDKLSKYVDVVKLDRTKTYKCKNLIINRITDSIPPNVEYGKCIRMIHGCKLKKEWQVPRQGDVYVPVSNAVKESFKDEFKEEPTIINNFTYKEKPRKALRLISATRLTFEKGEDRIYKMAEELNRLKIPFIWTVFTNGTMKRSIPNVVVMEPVTNIIDYIASSDYMVALSDSEAFGYSIVESLEAGIPVITTPIDVLNELGFVDGKHGYIIPFDMNGFDYNKLFNIPKFEFEWNNTLIKKQWSKLLNLKIDKKEVERLPEEKVKILITGPFYSTYLNRNVHNGEIIYTTEDRAKLILNYGLCRILGKEV